MTKFESILKIISAFLIVLFYINCKTQKNRTPFNKNIYEKENIQIMRDNAAECTLFLNKNDEFPIKEPCNVLLIGSGARNTIKGGLGSGDVESRYYTTCEDGLKQAGFTITSNEWLNQYPILKEEKVNEHISYLSELLNTYKGSGFMMVAFPEYDMQIGTNEEEERADIAIYVLARNSGEGTDRRLIQGDVSLTDKEIEDILYLNKKFKKFMLVLNVGGVVDLSPVKDVSNILLLSQLGVVTGDILADIILGKQNPSGKLSTTWASVNDYKFINEFSNLDDTNYVEGVYVGYRYFDSEGIKPLFPFGFGQSYTSFSITKISLTNIKNEITIIVSVKNKGKYSGKEVVQVYVSPSQENIDKPYQSLVAFKKTPKIEPSDQVEISLKFKLKIMERYDEKKAYYLLDKGKYIIRVGNSSNCTKVYGYVELDEDIITKQLKNINSNPDFEDYKSEVTYKDDLTNVQKIKLTKEDFKQKIVEYKYDYDIPPQIEKLENEELAKLCIGNYKDRNKEKSFERETGLAGTTSKDVKGIDNYLKMADGPAGLRISRIFGINYHGYHKLSENPMYTNSFIYYSTQEKISLTPDKNKDIPNLSKYSKIVFQYTTAIPIATALAQSFNVDFLEKCGDIVGKEMEIFDIHLWLAPALNIHRNILCGRNFEYFSEDPLLSGKLAAAITIGVQSHKNRGATIKHFAGNNQEFNRGNNNSKMSERALREIYLKGFQIAIKESSPLALMTSYNLINGIHTSHNSQLLINVLRNEWKYKGLVMTDWSHSYHTQFQASKYPPQNAFDIIKGGVNVMMPGGDNDYDLIIEKLKNELLTRDDLLQCASKVYEITELLNNK